MRAMLMRTAIVVLIPFGMASSQSYGQAPRAGTRPAGQSASKAKDCRQAAREAVVNCGAAAVTGGAAVLTMEPPANLVVGLGVPVGVCGNEAIKVADACGSRGPSDKADSKSAGGK